MRKILGLIVIATVLISCNVQERIIFNENMGGTYESSFDMSNMMKMAGQGRPASVEREQKKVDTLIVFNEMMVKFKDSIASLPAEKQAQLAKLKDMTMRMQMDEEAGVFKFSANKTFKEFKDVAYVSSQMEEVFNMAKAEGAGEQAAGPGGDMLKADKVRFTFENNTFRRIDEKLAEAEENGIEIEEEAETEEDMMMAGMMGEFDEMLSKSKMTMIYSFPKKIKSVSHEGAIISPDGKMVTLSVDWKTLMDDKTLLDNFEVVLEE